ncbi:reverse transcriptase domain-containing protein [Tanacetum coccineum]
MLFPPLDKDEGTEGRMIIEEKIGGHCIHRMYADGGSASLKNTLPPLIGFNGEIIWSIRQIQLLVRIGDEEHSTSAWMNFVVVRSPSLYNGTIRWHGYGTRSVMAKALRIGYYWPTMHKNTRTLIRACQDCQVHKPVPRSPQQKPTPITSPWPFYKWEINIARPFPEEPRKLKLLIVAIDYFTRTLFPSLLNLVAYPALFRKYPEPFLCLVGMSRNYTLDEDTYPRFLHDNDEAGCLLLRLICDLAFDLVFDSLFICVEMDLLAFIRIADPTKVKVGERQRAKDEPKLLDSTIGRVVPLLPVAPDHAKSELEHDQLFTEFNVEDAR